MCWPSTTSAPGRSASRAKIRQTARQIAALDPATYRRHRIHGDDPRDKSWSTIVYGAALIGIMFAYPGGLAGLTRAIRSKFVVIRPRPPTLREQPSDPVDSNVVTAE